ncbi:hypothetical protein BDR07DRAFT_1417701 [Suillus spraguei]|nr:hypothetical protein BDR07DRAFT_1417701 [Suillus spraguei]
MDVTENTVLIENLDSGGRRRHSLPVGPLRVLVTNFTGIEYQVVNSMSRRLFGYTCSIPYWERNLKRFEGQRFPQG